MSIPLWLDCDTGADDSFAIILAGHSPHINLLGISTVYGNNTVEMTTENTLRIANLSGLSDVKVYKGAARPIVKPLDITDGIKVHGESGLGQGIEIPLPRKSSEDDSAIYHIYNHLSKSKEKVTICATGTLTNIALLLMSFPDVTEKIDKLIVMGGALEKGNITPHAEYNIFTDAESASIVFRSSLNVRFYSFFHVINDRWF